MLMKVELDKLIVAYDDNVFDGKFESYEFAWNYRFVHFVISR